MNKVILCGRAGADAEVKFSESGSAIATLRVATDNRPSKDGEQAEATWHSVKFFGKLAEVVGEHVKKGRSVLIEGRINNGSYEKDGQTKYFSEVIADHFEFVGAKPAEAGAEG